MLGSGDITMNKVGRHDSSCKGNQQKANRDLHILLFNWNTDECHEVKIKVLRETITEGLL